MHIKLYMYLVYLYIFIYIYISTSFVIAFINFRPPRSILFDVYIYYLCIYDLNKNICSKVIHMYICIFIHMYICIFIHVCLVFICIYISTLGHSYMKPWIRPIVSLFHYLSWVSLYRFVCSHLTIDFFLLGFELNLSVYIYKHHNLCMSAIYINIYMYINIYYIYVEIDNKFQL
jgi:ABC-type polysaccharide transport system permease subunit